LFKARPIKATRDKDIFVSASGTHDIPEVSLSDMEIVFESRNAFEVERGFVKPNTMVTQSHLVRMIDGTPYRLICENFDIEAAAMLFGRAFPQDQIPKSYPAYGAEISLSSDPANRWPAMRSPLSRPLYEQFHWRLSCEQVDKRRLGDLWPPFEYARKKLAFNSTIPAGSTYVRNYMSFDEVRRDLEQVDEVQLSYCHAAFRKHMERFVLADGQLWQRTQAPVYKVMVDYAVKAVSVVMTYAPDWHDTNVNVRYFDLGDRDEAFQCAQQMVEAMNENEPNKYKVSDYTVPFDIDDKAPFFESGEDELFRLASAVASENRRIFYRNPKQIDRFAPDRSAAVWRAFEEVRKTDYIFEEYGDPIKDIRANMDIWRSLGSRQATYTFDQEQLRNLAFRRVPSLEENRTITLSPILVSHRRM
jgi:hypothetical protein